MRILGIDPGLSITGYACVETRPRGEPALVEAGVLRFTPRQTVASRVVQLHDDIAGLIEELKPRVFAIEKLFAHAAHPRTSVIMAHGRGVALLAAQRAGLEIVELASTEVKKSITGSGHASKHQMQRAVMHACGLKEPPTPPDVADAIAIGLCAARRATVARRQ